VYLALRKRGVVRTRSEARMVAQARVRAAKDEVGAAVELPANWQDLVVERYLAAESGPAIAEALRVSRPGACMGCCVSGACYGR
jgi:hypothetical protein